MDGQLVGRKKKKLEDAASYWVRGGNSYSEVISDLRAFGAPEDVIAEFEQAQKTEDFEVWPENWTALELFLALQTQWRIGGMGTFVGLDYNAARWVFDLHNPPNYKEAFEQLVIIEHAALILLNEKTADGS